MQSSQTTARTASANNFTVTNDPSTNADALFFLDRNERCLIIYRQGGVDCILYWYQLKQNSKMMGDFAVKFARKTVIFEQIHEHFIYPSQPAL